ncbi:MAG TPA: hypothetical protein VGS79_28325, partial [Puia sp.]|nr:hypothetical protein [Puia sp.]
MQQHNRRQFLGQTVLLGTGLFLPASLFPLGAVSATSSDEDRLRFLQGFGARLTPFLYRYNGSQRVAALPFRGHKLSSDGEAWECVVQQGKTPANADAMDIQFSFTLKKRDAFSTGVAAVFDLADWNPEMYVLIPASVYNGNRNRVVDRNYAAGLDRSDLYRKDLPLTTGPLPQLSPMEGTPSKLEVSVCNTTTPAVVLYNRASKRAFVVLTEQGSVFGDHGFTITESADRKSASLAICAPGVRERKPLFVGFEESPDRGAHWAQGSTLTLRLRVYIFDAPGIPAVLDRFHAVRKDVTGMNHPRNLIPFSEVVAMMTKRIDHRFYNGSHSFYCPENATWISYGWIGGLMDTFPMLVLGDQSHLERVIQTFDFAIPGGQGPAGYFYGATDQTGRNFGREGYDEYPEIVLTRKNADLLFWLIKQFLVLKVQGRGNAIKPEWETGVRRLADAFVNTWRQEGQWGNFLNNRTGGIAVYNTTSGAMAIGGLALASAYYDHPPYLQLASEAALFYYDRDFQALGMTTGGCADILQNADSETASGLMTALMALYEITGDGQWLERSSHLAHLLATWTVSFDYQLPPDTELGRLGAKLTGAVWASTQNKHAAPGICTSSGDPLFRIYRATGDTRYAQLLHDIIHAHAEGIRADGTITERLNYCDADGTRGFRGAPGSTGWNELNGILMAMEIPGIYVRVDTGVIYVFDHVVARILRRDGASADIEITNPTPFRADISLLVENAQLSEKPLGYTTFLSWPKIIVDAGETRVTTVTMGCFSQEYRTSSFVMQLNDKGQVTSFQHNGIQYAAINNPGWLLQIVNKGDTLQPVKAVFGKGNIHLTYPDGTIADVKVTLRRSYITLVLLAINKAVDAVKWGPFNTSISDTIGNTVGVVRSGAYAIGLQCLNKKTTGGQLSNEEGAIFDRGTTAVAKPFGSSLQAFTINRSHDRKISVWGQWPDVPVKGIPDGDVSGSAIAIFGSEPANVLAVIKSITQEEGLPYAQWKGQWIKQSDEVGRPYMITTFSESDIDTFLLCAKEMGMAGVYHEGPFETWGHFVLNQTLFPHGISGFKACVEKAHAMGLRLGFHTLSNFITTNDPFVTPKPDPRLALAGSSELIENVSADATEILVKDNHYFQLKSALNSIRIGEEIIRYASVTDQPPFRLTGCVRGAFGTNR